MALFRTQNISFSGRSKILLKNQLLIILNRPISIVVNFLLVPLTIDFVSNELYGLWLTIQSVVMWISYFDFGLANGFKNRFAEARAIGNEGLARKYVSTTYCILFIILLGFIFLFLIANNFLLDWASVLNLSSEVNGTIVNVFNIMMLFFAVFFVLNILSALLAADQKVAVASIITTVSQSFTLLIIFILKFFISGNIYILVLITSGIPCVVLFVASFYYFRTRYKKYSPSLKFVDFKLLKDIMGLGSKFFLIQISLLVIFHVMNLFLMRNYGGESVTLYNVTFRYYNIIYMIINIIISPLWPAFTDAYQKKDYQWMNNIYRKLSIMWWLSIPLAAIMFFISPYIFHLWLGDDIIISSQLSVFVIVYVLLMSRANLYMYMINGIGTIMVQLFGYVIIALISIPAINYTSIIYGIQGIVIVPSVAYLIQSVLCQIQLKKILNKSASGIWLK